MEYINNIGEDIGKRPKRPLTPEEHELLMTLQSELNKAKRPIRNKDRLLVCPMCETPVTVESDVCPLCGQHLR